MLPAVVKDPPAVSLLFEDCRVRCRCGWFDSCAVTHASQKRLVGEIFLVNAYIPEYLQANQFNHETKRPRKLLLHRSQVNKLIGAVQREGMTIVPLKIYFNDRGRAKVEIALARGKKLHDKREAAAKRDAQRRIAGELGRRRGRGGGDD